MPDLEPAIRQMLDATNNGDNEAFLDTFAEDAADVQRDGDEIRVGIQVTGDGYNGGGAMTFVLSGDRIGRMVITG
jgi:hypothetical protein